MFPKLKPSPGELLHECNTPGIWGLRLKRRQGNSTAGLPAFMGTLCFSPRDAPLWEGAQ